MSYRFDATFCKLLCPGFADHIYYAAWIGLVAFLLSSFPWLRDYFPVGGVGALADRDLTDFEPIYSSVDETVLNPTTGSAGICLPGCRRPDRSGELGLLHYQPHQGGRSVVRTVDRAHADCRNGHRNDRLEQLGIGVQLGRHRRGRSVPFLSGESGARDLYLRGHRHRLGSGIGALGVATVISMAFVYANLIIWKLEYGKTLSGSFLGANRRDRAEEDL